MEKSDDFRELFELFNRHNVEYVIVGAYALAIHGAPRFTGDIDVLVNATPANAGRVLMALDDFGFGALGLQQDDFTRARQVIQLGYPPARIDLLTSVSGVDWDEIAENALCDTFSEVAVRYIGREQYIKNKLAAGRPKDLADIDALSRDNE